MRGATGVHFGSSITYSISTHTPLARRDDDIDEEEDEEVDFYSHASCEARHKIKLYKPDSLIFLLTRLLRGATSLKKFGICVILFLLTRLLRGATFYLLYYIRDEVISTHTPLARRDTLVRSI